MLTTSISLKNFQLKKKDFQIKRFLTKLLKENNQILVSLGKSYKDNFVKKKLKKYKNYNHFRIIGMGGSILGSQTIYSFLRHKIKKNFSFIDNLDVTKKNDKKKYVNLIISKSGNTIETIANSNIFIKKKDKNIFITENKKSYLYLLAQKLKSDIIHHNNYIGGRYSVLSEVGMLPAELMGLNTIKFRQLNYLIKNKKFINALIDNVNCTLFLIKRRAISKM